MTDKERQQNVLRLVYALNTFSKDTADLTKFASFLKYDQAQLKQAVGDLVALMPWLMRKWTNTDNVEGKLYQNETGELEIVKSVHGCPAGSVVEINVCGTWIKTKIESVGKTFYAEGLKGFPLVGVIARVPGEVEK